MSDEKYIAFKRDEFAHWYQQWNGSGTEPIPLALNDAVVIRTQDVFAAGGLSAYAHQIQAFLNFGEYDSVTRSQLLTAWSYFNDVAQEAEERLARGECKVPD